MGDHTGGQDYALLPSAVSFTIPGMATAATKSDGSCDGDCMMATRYANIIHAQRKAYVDKRLLELSKEDPHRYFADEWAALYDAKLSLCVDAHVIA
jgi:hypothetical protein